MDARIVQEAPPQCGECGRWNYHTADCETGTAQDACEHAGDPQPVTITVTPRGKPPTTFYRYRCAACGLQGPSSDLPLLACLAFVQARNRARSPTPPP